MTHPSQAPAVLGSAVPQGWPPRRTSVGKAVVGGLAVLSLPVFGVVALYDGLWFHPYAMVNATAVLTLVLFATTPRWIAEFQFSAPRPQPYAQWIWVSRGSLWAATGFFVGLVVLTVVITPMTPLPSLPTDTARAATLFSVAVPLGLSWLLRLMRVGEPAF